ncbi:MAG: FAD-binding oxidoreductase [Thermodesulfobacteriota bacterium]|nr:FAD-binding oxidoreductase [Thermodesulfobacteriota bacterium]
MMTLTGWGRYPETPARIFQCMAGSDVADCLKQGSQWIAHGLGRSYGDSALGENVLLVTPMNRVVHFDDATGVLRCEAGISLGEVISALLPRGWFLPVTPGTRHVTVGGAIASDVHGKNHHLDGSFSRWVHDFTLMLADGSVVTCSANENPDLFHATCGGMGLTGIVLSATLRMRRVVSAYMDSGVVFAENLKALLDCFGRHGHWPYLVAWVDCTGTGTDIGRGLVFMGRHAMTGDLRYAPKQELTVPGRFPGWLLMPRSARLFNRLYARYYRMQKSEHRVSVESFFFPLDRLGQWHRLYGRSGMLQYQFVLPKAAGAAGLRRIFSEIRRHGATPFLGVLKLLGEENDNYLSFPRAGYTLALDFKAHPAVFALLDTLDDIVADHGGRVYLAKDARMKADMLPAGYPCLDAFREVREQYGLIRTFQSLQSRRLAL